MRIWLLGLPNVTAFHLRAVFPQGAVQKDHEMDSTWARKIGPKKSCKTLGPQVWDIFSGEPRNNTIVLYYSQLYLQYIPTQLPGRKMKMHATSINRIQNFPKTNRSTWGRSARHPSDCPGLFLFDFGPEKSSASSPAHGIGSNHAIVLESSALGLILLRNDPLGPWIINNWKILNRNNWSNDSFPRWNGNNIAIQLTNICHTTCHSMDKNWPKKLTAQQELLSKVVLHLPLPSRLKGLDFTNSLGMFWMPILFMNLEPVGCHLEMDWQHASAMNPKVSNHVKPPIRGWWPCWTRSGTSPRIVHIRRCRWHRCDA